MLNIKTEQYSLSRRNSNTQYNNIQVSCFEQFERREAATFDFLISHRNLEILNKF